jgi:hypothetical protein
MLSTLIIIRSASFPTSLGKKVKKMSKCYKCENEAGEAETIELEVDGFKFKRFKTGSMCKECNKEEIARLLKKYAGFITKREDDTIAVDWPMYAQKRSGRTAEELEPEMLDLLEMLGLLNICRDNAWNIDGGGFPCNPRRNSFPLFFTREEDAMEYARVVFGTAHYPVEIFLSSKWRQLKKNS